MAVPERSFCTTMPDKRKLPSSVIVMSTRPSPSVSASMIAEPFWTVMSFCSNLTPPATSRSEVEKPETLVPFSALGAPQMTLSPPPRVIVSTPPVRISSALPFGIAKVSSLGVSTITAGVVPMCVIGTPDSVNITSISSSLVAHSHSFARLRMPSIAVPSGSIVKPA